MVISNLNIKQIEDRLGFIIKSIARLKRLSRLDQEVYPQKETVEKTQASYAEERRMRRLL